MPFTICALKSDEIELFNSVRPSVMTVPIHGILREEVDFLKLGLTICKKFIELIRNKNELKPQFNNRGKMKYVIAKKNNHL